MVRFHPGSLIEMVCRQHAVVCICVKTTALRSADFGSAVLGCWFNSRTDLFGLLVQREDAWLATRKSGFDSPAVHWKS